MAIKKYKDFNYSEVEFGTPHDLEHLSARADLTIGKNPTYTAPTWSSDHILVRLLGVKNFSKFCKAAWGREVFVFDCEDNKLLAQYFNVEHLRKNVLKSERAMLSAAHKADRGLDSLARDFYQWTDLKTSIDLYAHPKKSPQGHWHWDSMDKFLFFIEGDGALEVFKPIGPMLLPQQNFKNIRHINEQDSSHKYTIPKIPGRIVYIPRGVPHRHNFSKTTRSMHAPVWLQPITLHRIWSRLTGHALIGSESQMLFRQAVGPAEISKLKSQKSIQKISKLFKAQFETDLLEYMWRQERILSQHISFDLKLITQRSRKRLRTHPESVYFQRTQTRYDLNDQFGVWELILPNKKVYFSDSDKKIFVKILKQNHFQLDDLRRMKLSKESIQKIAELLITYDLYRVEKKPI